MEEVLDIYKQSYDVKYPVVCMDESSKQLTKEVRESFSMKPKEADERVEEQIMQSEPVEEIQLKPGQIEKYDTEYERNGTANIFMAFEPLQGLRFTSVTEQKTRKDWAEFIKDLVDNHYVNAEKIILVMRIVSYSSYNFFKPIKSVIPGKISLSF